jgi:hypothetical protein
MDPQTFINDIVRAVVDNIQKAPPKPFTVFRKPSGATQNVSLGQLMAEMSDQLIISNNLQRDAIRAIQEHTAVLKENTKIGKSILKKSKRRRDDDDDDDDEDGV